MGKRSQQRMTGLSSGQRIKRSEKRRATEEKRRAKEAAELTKAMLGLPQLEAKDVWELPPRLNISPVMRQLLQLERESKRGKKVG